MDFFIIAHIFGWFAKTILLRDVWICWILSIMFEFCEYSLQHQLPNFAECWWDHWLLDVLICNWLGIWMGMRVIYWLRMKPYNWRSIQDIPTITGKVKRSVAQFTPYSWTDFNWAATKSLKGYVIVVLLCTLLLTSEVMGFYLKYLLWIPPPNILYVGRSILYAFAGCAGIRELYQYCTDSGYPKIGSQAWVLMAIIVTEVLVVFKWGKGNFTAPFPKLVIAFWSVFILIMTIFPIWQFYLKKRFNKKT